MNVQTNAKPAGWKVSTAGRSLDVLSRQWIARPHDERFLSLDDLVGATKLRAERTEQITLPNRKLEVISPTVLESDDRATALAKTQQLLFGLPGGREVAPTNWAFGQIAGLAKAPGAYLRTLPSPIVADAVQYGLRYNRDAEDVKLFADDLEALAVTGPDYGRIFNWEVAEAVSLATQGSAGDHRWKIPGMLDWSTSIYDPLHPVSKDTTTLFANDRGVFIFLCQDLAPIEIGKLPNGEPDLVFRGFYVTNSETGAGALKLGAMYLRAVCCNRILWGVEAFEELTMRHTKYAPARFIEEARPALESFANGSTTKLLDGIAQARMATVANNKEEALAWIVERGIARKRALNVYDAIVKEEWQGEENDERPVDAWTLAQGMTAAARDEPNFDTRLDLEREAGKLLDKVA
jgi:hypothetical protein